MTTTLPSIPNSTGVYAGLSFSQYVQIKALNWHTLIHFRQSPKHARTMILSPADANEEQVLGEYSHACILEPHRLATDYVVMPEFEGHHNSNAYKDAKRAWLDAHASQVALTSEESNAAEQMIASIDAHPLALPRILRAPNARKELTILWIDKETGVLCKGRIDVLALLPVGLLNKFATDPERKIVVVADLKTTRAGAGINGNSNRTMIELFNMDRLKYGYHGQLMFYADGLATLRPADILPVLVPVQNAAEWDCLVCPFSDDLQTAGRQLYRKLLNQYATCTKYGKWPGVCDGPVDLAAYGFEIEEETDNGTV